MSTCQAVYTFLSALGTRTPPGGWPTGEVEELTRLGLVSFLDATQYAALAEEVQGLESARGAIERDGAERVRRAGVADRDLRRTHSLLFHFRTSATQRSEQAQMASDQAALRAEEEVLRADEERFARLVAQKSLFEALIPVAGGYLALTTAGSVAVRDLSVRLYRAADTEFPMYWAQAQAIERELTTLAESAGKLVATLTGALPGVDRSYLWAVAIGMAKRGGDPNLRAAAFRDALAQIRALGSNEENRLMAAEILSLRERPLDESLTELARLDAAVRGAAVPREASLGVAAILLLGQRQDGSFATANLRPFLGITGSYESAALLAVVNEPLTDLSAKFVAARALFSSWGFSPSEDMELSAAFLTASELPLEGVGPKLAIISQGLAHYLQYPLAAASILTSIPVMEANETLRLLESAYEILGRRTGPLPPSELICLAVRLIHGVRVDSVNALDPTAAAAAPSVVHGPFVGPIVVPLIVAHAYYYSTFSGIGGAHPGHAHSFGGFTG